MRAGPIMVGEGGRAARGIPANPRGAWKVLAGFGLLFVLAATADIGLALAPANLAEPGVRFVVLTGVGGSLPLMALGLLTFQMAMVGMGSRGGVAVGTTLNGLFLVLMAVGLMSLLGAREAALAGASEALQTQIRQAVVRALAGVTFFGAGHLLAVVTGVNILRGAGET
jgi:hypothetical protein